MTQRELDQSLYDAVAFHPHIDLASVEELLRQGANPLAWYEDDLDLGDSILSSVFANAQYDGDSIPENVKQLPDLLSLFLRYGMDVDDPTSDYDHLHSLTWLRHEYGLQALALLLDAGLSPAYADGFAMDLIGEMLQFEGIRDDNPAWIRSVEYAGKMVMLLASYERNFTGSNYLSHLIEPDRNDPALLPRFRHWENFRCEVDLSSAEALSDELVGHALRFYDLSSHTLMWEFHLQGELFFFPVD